MHLVQFPDSQPSLRSPLIWYSSPARFRARPRQHHELQPIAPSVKSEAELDHPDLLLYVALDDLNHLHQALPGFEQTQAVKHQSLAIAWQMVS